MYLGLFVHVKTTSDSRVPGHLQWTTCVWPCGAVILNTFVLRARGKGEQCRPGDLLSAITDHLKTAQVVEFIAWKF